MMGYVHDENNFSIGNAVDFYPTINFLDDFWGSIVVVEDPLINCIIMADQQLVESFQ